ncbi:MAG: gliding motility protein GldL [Bacteroidota bacterium]
MGAKKKGIGAWMATPPGRKVMGYAFGIGAAVVILGALFKIMHWPGCNPMLIAGLGTEAVLFTMSSFQLTHAEPDWSIYYPYAYPENERHRGYYEKGGNYVKWDGDDVNPLAISGGDSGQDYGAKIDAMMEKAGVNQALFDKLGNGISKLHTTAESLKDVSNAAGAVSAYEQALNTAAANISQLSDSYAVASKKVADITVDGTGVQDFGSQITTAANNLKELNASLAGVGSLQTVMTSLSESADDTKAYASNMKVLAKNLEDLNSVYGNMLRAMGK